SAKWVTLVLAALGSDGSPPPGAGCATGAPRPRRCRPPPALPGARSTPPRAGCASEPRPMRYSELLRLLAGVSQKMLTQTLRSLERDGLVTRTATPTVPVTVSYELTDLGLSLHHMMRGLKTWAELHMDDVLANRATYDARTAGA